MPPSRHAPLPGFLARRVQAFYNESVRDRWDGTILTWGRERGPDDIFCGDNDYLRLAGHPEIVKAQDRSHEANGQGPMMSAVFQHGDSPFHRFERLMAHHMGSEKSVLTQSGMAANMGLIQVITDAETPVYIDHLAHGSFWYGCQAAGIKPKPFRHNDMESLEKRIARHGPGVILVDSVYSASGSVAHLHALASIAGLSGCVLVVDESHSLGTHGPRGAGLVVELGLTDQVHFRTASLSKAFVNRAGIIAMGRQFWTYYMSRAWSAIFSSTVPPADASALLKTLELVRAADTSRATLHSRANQLRAALRDDHWDLGACQSQIVPLHAGDEPTLRRLRDAMETRGVFGAPFFPPATPPGQALLRLSIHCDLGEDDIERIVRAAAASRQALRDNGVRV
ncbi:MAG: alpha-hydroxyketone-type quorum-sensing autoinducer synthase [Gammaproteobacteria bacterium]